MSDELETRDALRERFSRTPPLPDEVLRETLERVPETPQQRSRWWWPFGLGASTSSLPGRRGPTGPDDTMSGGVPSPSGSAPGARAVPVALVALVLVVFGGVLSFSVLAPRDAEPMPGGSASPSVSPGPTATEAPLASPTAATTASASATIVPFTTSLAASEPGFVAEPIEPGVERIVSDGAGYDLRALEDGVHVVFEDIASGPGGDIWVVARRYHARTGRTEGPFAFELGSDGEYGAGSGFPSDAIKLVIDDDGTPRVAAPDGIRAFDGSVWVERPGTRAVRVGGGTVWLVEPGDVSDLAPGGIEPDHMLVLGSDIAGYVLDGDVGRRFMRDWPSWWESCSADDLAYRNGTGCIDRTVRDDRGIGVGHDDEGRALFLAAVETGRLARSEDGAIWVLGGPTIEDFWAGRADGVSAIHRIDPSAPGHDCDGC